MAEMPGVKEESLHGLQAMEKVRGLLKSFRTAMLVTTSGLDQFDVRPMALIGTPERFDGVLWFFTDDRSRKMHETTDRHAAAVALQNDDDSVYLELSGRVTQRRDRDLMGQLYTPLVRTWFPDGLDDPHLTLLRFDADSGRYWTSNGIVHELGAFVKSVATGERSQGGETGTLDL